MAYYDARAHLASDAADQRLRMAIPQDGNQYTAVYRLEGTFVGTIQAQVDGSAVDTVELLATGTVSAGHPTDEGLFAADCGADAEELVIVFSAYTSGGVAVEAVLIAQP